MVKKLFTAQKRMERRQVELALTEMGLGHCTSALAAGESPDFTFQLDDRLIGIEAVEFFYPEGDKEQTAVTTVSRPNREALDKALNIFRDAMRPFIVRHLRQVPGATVEEAIKRSLPDRKVAYFEQNLGNKGGNISASIDVNDFPRLVQRNWRETFAAPFGNANTITPALWLIADGRNQTAHPGDSDLEIEYVRTQLFHIADLLDRINAPEEAGAVLEIRNNLTMAPPATATAENLDETTVPSRRPNGDLKTWRDEALEPELEAKIERQFAGHTFERVGHIQPERDHSGELVERLPEANVPLHIHGDGPFCRFSIAQQRNWRRLGGVFVVTSDGAVRSVGETEDLARYWYSRGRIAPAAVRKKGGQQANCRINSLILGEAKRGADIVLWFHSVQQDAERKELKARLIAALNPPWDLTRPQFLN